MFIRPFRAKCNCKRIIFESRKSWKLQKYKSALVVTSRPKEGNLTPLKGYIKKQFNLIWDLLPLKLAGGMKGTPKGKTTGLKGNNRGLAHNHLS